MTLQVNFAGNRALTWRRSADGSRKPWRRFHVARGGIGLIGALG